MKTPLFTAAALLALTFGACSPTEAPKTDAPAIDAVEVIGEVKTKAVLLYADWCGSCKTLDPKIKAAQAMGNIPGLEFVILDYTDKDADALYAQAAAAGVEKAVRDHLNGTIKTGSLLLVDVDDEKVVGKVTKKFEPTEIVSALKEAVSTS